MCERFGWTPAQLGEVDEALIDKFLAIMSIEAQLKNNGQEGAMNNG